MTQDGPQGPGQVRHRLDEACLAMAESHAQVKRECDALEALLDDPGAGPGRTQVAHARVRVAGIQSMRLTTAYLTALNTYMTQTGRKEI